MNPIILMSGVIVSIVAYALWRSNTPKKDANDPDTVQNKISSEKLAELRAVAERERVNLIELAHSVDPDLLRHVSLNDILCGYSQSLPAEIRKKVFIGPEMCSTFDEFYQYAKSGYPLSEAAAEKMYSLRDFWSLERMQWSGRLMYKDAYYRAYWPKFNAWLEQTKSCEEIARLGCWNLNCDYVTSPQWAPATDRYIALCQKEMNSSNDLQTLWRLRSTKRTCMFGSFDIEMKLFKKILTLTNDLDELKRLAYPRDYEGRVETEEYIAKPYYINAVEARMLECGSVEDLRIFLNSHDIPIEAKALSLRLMATLPATQTVS